MLNNINIIKFIEVIDLNIIENFILLLFLKKMIFYIKGKKYI